MKEASEEEPVAAAREVRAKARGGGRRGGDAKNSVDGWTEMVVVDGQGTGAGDLSAGETYGDCK